MIEVVVKDHELQIYVNRQKLSLWLQGKGDIPWDGDPNSAGDSLTQAEIDKRAEELQKEDEKVGTYKTADGTVKDHPNDADGRDKKTGDTCGSHVADEDIGEKRDGIDLFDAGPNGIGGTLQDDPKGKDKIKDLRDWLKENKFNYKNFCLFLFEVKEVAGFSLSAPLIGLTQKKEPTIFQLATRYHSYWMSAKEEIAKQYQFFLLNQLEDMGVKILDAKGMVIEAFQGTEIDPKSLPKGVEVST